MDDHPTEPQPRIVLVEDDEGIARPLAAALRSGGYEVEHVATGAAALATVEDSTDAVIVDLGLPDLDGLELCRQLRARVGQDLPILILTARSAETDVVVGLDAGADDYVTKPFRLAELQARLRALLRRSPRADRGTVTAKDVRVERAARRAFRGQEELDLTPKEFDLLALLVSRAGVVVSREEIMRSVWQTEWFGSTRTLDMHVSSLRRKLGDDPDRPRYVATVRGVGLRFETGDDP